MHGMPIHREVARRGGRLGLILAVALAAGLPAAQAEDVEIGIIPTLSTRTILTTYQPLREHLEAQLKQPVTLVTAPDYRHFIERTQRGDYPYVLTAPHFARLAQTEAGYRPLVRVKRELHGIVVVRRDSPAQTLSDLRGKVISTPENIAVVTMLGLQLLRDHGLEPGKQVSVRPAASFNSAVLAVQNGESAAALTAPTALHQMPEATRAALRIIGTTRSVPHVIFLANRKVPSAEVERMTRLLLDFVADKTYGEPFFQHTGFQGFVRPTAEELRSLDPYVTELKRQLASP